MVCPRCGFQCGETDTFCMKCGAALITKSGAEGAGTRLLSQTPTERVVGAPRDVELRLAPFHLKMILGVGVAMITTIGALIVSSLIYNTSFVMNLASWGAVIVFTAILTGIGLTQIIFNRFES